MKLTKREKLILAISITTIAILCVVFYAIYPRAPSEEAPPADTTPPAQVTGLTVTNAYDGKLDLTWNSSAENDFDHYNIYRGGSKITETTDNSYRDEGLTNGQTYNYQVSAVDNSGNEGQKSSTASGTPTAADTSPPTISNLRPADNAVTTDNTPIIGADYSDPSGIDTTSVKITVDNVDVTENATVTSAGVTYTPTAALAEGQHTVEVRVSDNFGNEATENWTFTVDLEEKWALILGSANDFAKDLTPVQIDDSVCNPSFEDGVWPDPDCWKFTQDVGLPIPDWVDPLLKWGFPPHDGTYCVEIELAPGDDGYWHLLLDNWIPVTPNTQYTVTAWTKENCGLGAITATAYVGINWYDNGWNFISVDWSTGVTGASSWTLETLTATSPPNAAYADIKLRGQNPATAPDMCWVWFDDVSMWHYGDNPNPLPDRDGFPAQALQAYYVLKNHGYGDAHITLMLYHTNDAFIDIEGDGVNDLTNATIDVEDDAVTKARFVTEMQNLAAATDANDEVLMYMVDHGDNVGGTAYFCFEFGSENISEQEMALLLNNFTCERMTVLVDSCFSGNFISSLSGANRILVAAAGDDNLAKYWPTANPPSENYAGSWFFHPFWGRIDAGDSVQSAYNSACSTVPTSRDPYAGQTVAQIQNPQLDDGVGDAGTYTFV